MTTINPTYDLDSVYTDSQLDLEDPNNKKYFKRGRCHQFSACIGKSLCYVPKVIAKSLYSIPKKALENFHFWVRTRNTPLNQLTTQFIREIDQQNKCKNPNAPVALFLFAATDSNGALSSHGTEQLISMFMKTHRVALETIFENREIREKIRVHRFEKNEDVIILNCHGNTDRVVWERGTDSESSLTVENVSKETFEGVHPKTLILSTGCYTGSRLAQKIADVTALPVQAPTNALSNADSWIHKCETHGLELCCYSDSGHNIIQQFTSLQSQPQPAQTCVDPKGLKKTLEYQIEQLHLRMKSARIDYGSAFYQLKNLKNLIFHTLKTTQNKSEQQELQKLEVRIEEIQNLSQEKHSEMLFFLSEV